MYSSGSYNYVHPNMAYSHGFYDTAHHGRRHSPILGMPNEFDVGSTAGLAPLTSCMAGHGNRSSMACAPPPHDPASASLLGVGRYEHGRPRKEAWTASVFQGLRAIGTDGAAAVVSTIALCFFIGIAIWLLSAAQDQWDDNGINAADDADAGMHLEAYGAPPSSPVAGVHDKIPKIDWKITVGTRRPRTSKRSVMLTTELPDMALASKTADWTTGVTESSTTVGGSGDESDDSDDSDAPKAPWTSAPDTTVTVGSKRVHIRRRPPSSKGLRRSAKRRHKVSHHTVPRRDDVGAEMTTIPAQDEAS